MTMLYSCANNEKEESIQKEKTIEEEIEEGLGKTLPFEDLSDSMQVAHLVRVWNGYHNPKYIDKIQELYADELFFYGKDKTRHQAIEVKRSLLRKYPKYFQRILGTMQIKRIDFENYKVEFTKYVRVEQMTAPIPSYLTFHKVADNEWVIIAESDIKTDTKIKEHQDSIRVLKDLYTPSSIEISGRFSGSGMDTIYIFSDENESCSNCKTSLFFSNETLPPLDVKGAAHAQLLNEGDLDGDGREEFSTLTKVNNEGWITIYSFKQGKWNVLKKFKVNYYQLIEDQEARNNAIQLAGSGYIYIQKWERDTIVVEKVNVWNY